MHVTRSLFHRVVPDGSDVAFEHHAEGVSSRYCCRLFDDGVAADLTTARAAA